MIMLQTQLDYMRNIRTSHKVRLTTVDGVCHCMIQDEKLKSLDFVYVVQQDKVNGVFV